jgi:hypothetical protein
MGRQVILAQSILNGDKNNKIRVQLVRLSPSSLWYTPVIGKVYWSNR